MKVEKSCVTFLCVPCWYVHKPDVQNSWDDNTYTHADWAEGRLIPLYYILYYFIVVSCIRIISGSVENKKVVYYFQVKYIRNFAPDGHGTKFSCVGGGMRV